MGREGIPPLDRASTAGPCISALDRVGPNEVGVEKGKGVFCADIGVFCQDWARKGQCETNPGYMDKNCAKSCGRCIEQKDGSSILDPAQHLLGAAVHNDGLSRINAGSP
jgi:hypothetical protein